MKQRVRTAVRVMVLVGAIFTALTASSQIVVDYALEILPSGVPYPSGEVGYALLVTGNWSTNDQEPFVVHLNVPPELEPVSKKCHGYDGDVRFDAATRVVTWSHRMDNPSLAF